MFCSKIKNQEGQSLVELLVAMGIFVMIISSIMFLVLDAHMSNRQGGERSQATWLAQASIEASQSIKNRGWKYLESGDHGLITNNNRWEFAGTSDSIDQFTRQISVVSVYRAGNGDITETGGQIDFDTKKVVANVGWDFTPSRPSEVAITSVFTNWRSHKWVQTAQADFDLGSMNNIVSTGEDGGAVELAQGVAQYWGNQFLVESFATAGDLNKKEKKVAQTFTAQNSGIVNDISVYIEAEVGTSPTYRYGLQSDDNGLPSGTWLGMIGLGYGDVRVTSTGWQTISLREDVKLVAGEVYHLVVEWHSGKVDNRNYISLRSSRPQNNMIPYDNTEDLNSGVFWHRNRWTSTSLQPIFLIIFEDKSFEGNAYTEVSEVQIYRDLYQGQEFLVEGGDREVSGISFYVRKNSKPNPADDLYVTLYDITDSSPIEQGELALASTISRDYEWRSYDFATPVKLIDNHQYRVYLSSPSSDDRLYYLLGRLQNENSEGYNDVNYQAAASNFTDSRNGGGSWDAYRNSDIGGFRFTTSTGYALTGSFVSSAYDIRSAETVYNYLDWADTVPVNASLSFQIRTADRRNNLNSATWVGPDGTSDTNYFTPGQTIETDQDASGLRWVQYKAYFTSDGTTTPVLYDITIDHEP